MLGARAFGKFGNARGQVINDPVPPSRRIVVLVRIEQGYDKTLRSRRCAGPLQRRRHISPGASENVRGIDFRNFRGEFPVRTGEDKPRFRRGFLLRWGHATPR
jgi:hypothetical protein